MVVWNRGGVVSGLGIWEYVSTSSAVDEENDKHGKDT
jgi:hypothetical protein